MPQSHFLSHIQLTNPGFRCYKSGDRSKTPAYTARVSSIAGKPASGESRTKLEHLLGPAGNQIHELYELHNGLTLYRDEYSDAAGIEFLRISSWEAQTAEMRESFEAMGFSAEEMPEWFSSGVVFGEIPHSANFFLIGTEDNVAGKVFYVDHDDFHDEPITNDFDTLLEMITADPPAFLFDRGCYTRFSDGKSNSQWIPAEFVADVSAFAAPS